jgi:hypothetical protein
MEQATVQATREISCQQAHELRIIVFHKVYGWFDSLSSSGYLGLPQTDKNLAFLEAFSLQQVRAYLWELLGEEFGCGAEIEELPRNRYNEAKRFLKGIGLAALRSYIEKEGCSVETQEIRPQEAVLARRCIESVNISRAQWGYSPLKYRGNKTEANA